MAFFINTPSAPTFMSQLGAGLGQGLADVSKMTLAQKMQTLNEQRQLEKQMAIQEKQGGALAQALGMPQLAPMLSQLNPEQQKMALENMSMQSRNTALLEQAGLIPQQQREIPYEDREAVEEYEPQMQQQRQINLEGVRQKDIPQILAAQRAEETLNLQRQKADLGERKFEYQKEEPKRQMVSKSQEKLTGWQKQKPIFQYMAENAKNIGENTRYKMGFAKMLGIDPTLVQKDPEQVMNKMAFQLIQGIGSVFPGRILASELETYMKANPNLMNSPKALGAIAKIVIENGKLIEDEYKAIRSLSKKYKDKDDLYDAVQDEMQPKYDSVNKKINELTSGLNKKSQVGEVLMKNPEGQLGRVPSDRVEEALKKGYIQQ